MSRLETLRRLSVLLRDARALATNLDPRGGTVVLLDGCIFHTVRELEREQSAQLATAWRETQPCSCGVPRCALHGEHAPCSVCSR